MLQALLCDGPTSLENTRPSELESSFSQKPSALLTPVELFARCGIPLAGGELCTSIGPALDPDEAESCTAAITRGLVHALEETTHSSDSAPTTATASANEWRSRAEVGASETGRGLGRAQGAGDRSDETSTSSFERPAPALMQEQRSELSGGPISSQTALTWDDSAEVLPSTLELLRKLIVDAQLRPLAPLQQKRFLAALVRCSSFVLKHNIREHKTVP